MAGGVMSAPPRKQVFIVWGSFGTLSGAVSQPRGRLWILADGPELDATMTARAAWNNPRTGGVEYADLGPVADVTVRHGNHVAARLASGGTINLVSAPCVCGAGAVGNALPETGRLSIQNVSLYGRENVAIL
jgi:hypothetical protein